MKKNTVKINESQLHKIVSESIKAILREGDFDSLNGGEIKSDKDYDSYVLVDGSCDAIVGNYTSDAKSEAIEDAKAKSRETRGGSFSVFGCDGMYYDDSTLVYCTSSNRDSWKF